VTVNPDQFGQVIDQIDAVNKTDPKGYELGYSEKLSAWILKLKPQASQALRIAARGQHIARWTSPREKYPKGRGGYLRWREDLKKFHAEKVATIMKACGYSDPDIEPVKEIILKKNMKTNPDSQTMEDAVSLVFLEDQYLEFKKKTSEDKMKDILKKTWRKMSPQGQQCALQISFPPQELEFIKLAVQ